MFEPGYKANCHMKDCFYSRRLISRLLTKHNLNPWQRNGEYRKAGRGMRHGWPFVSRLDGYSLDWRSRQNYWKSWWRIGWRR